MQVKGRLALIKKIHYCWFGSAVPEAVAKNVQAWQQLNPGYEIRQWNDHNTDVSEFAYGRRARENKRWGFVADIVRLQKLYEEGGFYFDTDVELLRPLDGLANEGDFLILGYMYECSLGTAVIYSPARHPMLAKVLEETHHVREDCWPVNNTIFTDYFINRVPGFLVNGRRWKSDQQRISVYPKEFFEQPAFFRRKAMALHHFTGSWMPKNVGAAFQIDTGSGGLAHKLRWAKRKVRTFCAMLISQYRTAYLWALLGRRVQKHSWWRKN